MIYIFDLDNTLFDTNSTIHQCYQESLEIVLGGGISLSPQTKMILDDGGNWESAWRHTKGISEVESREIHIQKRKLYQERLNQIKPFEHTMKLFLRLISDSRVVIWSNARYEVITTLLRTVDVHESSVEILGREFLVVPKPSPNSLLLFLKNNLISPSDVCVFDDSEDVIFELRKQGIAAFLSIPGSK